MSFQTIRADPETLMHLTTVLRYLRKRLASFFSGIREKKLERH